MASEKTFEPLSSRAGLSRVGVRLLGSPDGRELYGEMFTEEELLCEEEPTCEEDELACPPEPDEEEEKET